eukprot:7831963-Ditylum_brightwellii.AAC.1
MSDTAAKVDADTLRLITHTVPIPQFGDAEAMWQAITNIVHLLKQPATNNIPDEMKGDAIVQSFANIANLLGQKKVTLVPTQHATTEVIKSKEPPSFLLPPLQVSDIYVDTVPKLPHPVVVHLVTVQVTELHNQPTVRPPTMMPTPTQIVQSEPIIV